MSNIVSRNELMEAFAQLASQFEQALIDTKEKDRKFEDLLSQFNKNFAQRLGKAQGKLPKNSPVSAQINAFTE